MAIRSSGVLCFALASALCVSTARGETFQLYNQDFDTPPVSASVVGAFNNWDASAGTMTPNDAGFVADVPLGDEEHAYAFYVTLPDDSQTLITDPRTNAYTFGESGETHSLIKLQDGLRVAISGLEPFALYAPESDEVFLAGDFNQWNPSAIHLLKYPDGVWRAFLQVSRPCTYKYIVDGWWKTEPLSGDNEFVPDNFGGENNYRPSLVPSDDPGEEGGTATAIFTATEDQTSSLERTDATEPQATRNDATLHDAQELAKQGNYKDAVLACRAIRAQSTNDPATKRQSLRAEAEIHRQFGRKDRAAKLWERCIRDYPTAYEDRRASRADLAKYYLYEANDAEKARIIYDIMLSEAADERQQAAALHDQAVTYLLEKRWQETFDLSNEALTIAPSPDGADASYTHLWTELLLVRGNALVGLEKLEEARDDYEQVLVILQATPHTQNAQVARRWIDYIEAQGGKN